MLLIAALAVPALVILTALSWQAYASQRLAVRTELSNTARAVAGLVDTEIERSFTVLQVLAAARSLRDGDWDTFDATARRALPDGKRWFVLVDMSGRQIVNTRLPRGAIIPNIDLDPEYVAAMRAGRTFISNVVYGPAAQSLVVHVGQPFAHANGQLYGIGVVTTPDALGESLNVRRYAPEGVVSVVDRQAKIITRNPYQKEFIGGSATRDMVLAIREGTEGARDSVTLEGIPVLTVIARARCGWSVLLGMPKAKLFATAQRILYFGLTSTLVVTIGAIVLATSIARAVVRGVDDLARDAERLARGAPAGPFPSDLQEFQTVAQAMRQMAATKGEAEAQLRDARDRLQNYAHELETRVEERTASLREAVTQMEEFSYTVSHDLRGPLRTIQGFAEILMEEAGPKLDEQSRDYLNRISRASERLNRLTLDILAYSRVARADLARERVALEPLVREVIEQHHELHQEVAEVKVVTPMHDVLGHPASLVQALTNLLTNAAKFVKPGERPHITVRTERRGARVRTWVEDRGIGIPPEHQARLFQMFERATSATNYQGTGVGLAIVRKIVEKSGGSCGMESDGKTGSRFWIELPAADGAGEAPPA